METQNTKKVYTIYQVKEIQKKDGQTDYIITNIWDTTNRQTLAKFLETDKTNLSKYKSTYNIENDNYNIKATKSGFTYIIDYE